MWRLVEIVKKGQFETPVRLMVNGRARVLPYDTPIDLEDNEIDVLRSSGAVVKEVPVASPEPEPELEPELEPAPSE